MYFFGDILNLQNVNYYYQVIGSYVFFNCYSQWQELSFVVSSLFVYSGVILVSIFNVLGVSGIMLLIYLL